MENDVAPVLPRLVHVPPDIDPDQSRGVIRWSYAGQVASAGYGVNQAGGPAVDLILGDDALRVFAAYTTANVGDSFAIALDGVVEWRSSSVNQMVITGESEPVPRSPGERVFAGSVNGRGALTVRVTRRYEDTTLARIVSLIEESQKQRAPVQQTVDRFARLYTPAVLGVAALVAVLPPLLLAEPAEVWFYRSLVLLVIACPCALGISPRFMATVAVYRDVDCKNNFSHLLFF